MEIYEDQSDFSSLTVYSTLEEGEDLSTPLLEDGKFKNPWSLWYKPTIKESLKFIFSSLWKRAKAPTKRELEEHLPVLNPNFDLINNPNPENIHATWIGHSSFLIQMNGLNFLTDPVFANRASPVQFAGPNRIRPLPMTLEELPPIDFVLVSHNHYDHLDISVVKYFQNQVGWVIPKNLGKWFTDQGVSNFVELGWWDKCDLFEDLSVVGLPAQHWSKRTATDDMESLWLGFSILGKGKKVYFAGDTGYNEIVFKEIGDKFGPFDLSLIPIGAYDPRDFLSPQHIGPEDAVQIHTELNSKKSVGIHWGTFVLSNEPVLEPKELLQKELQKREIDEDSFIVLKHGETLIV